MPYQVALRNTPPGRRRTTRTRVHYANTETILASVTIDGASVFDAGAPIFIAPAVATNGVAALTTTPIFITSAAFAGTAVLNPGSPVLLVVTAGYQAAVLEDAPILYVRLNESAGTNADDISGSDADGTYTGGYTLAQTGALALDSDKSVSLDGSSGYIALPNLGLTNGTVEMWIKPTTVSGDKRLLSQLSGASSQGGSLSINQASGESGSLWVWTGSTWNRLANTGAIVADVWQHLVFVYAGGNVTAYVDGVEHLTAASGFDFSGPDAGIGAKFATFGGTFPGLVDEVAVYSGALSATRIAIHYDIGINGGGATSFVGAGALNIGVPVIVSSVSIAGIATFDPGTPELEGGGSSAAFNGTSTVDVGVPILLSAANFAGTSVLSSAPVFNSSATLAGVGVLAATNPVLISSVAINGTSLLTASNPVFVVSSVSLNGTSVLTTNPVFDASITFAAVGTLNPGSPQFLTTVSINGTSTLTATPIAGFIGFFNPTSSLGTIFSSLGLIVLGLPQKQSSSLEDNSVVFNGTSTFVATPQLTSPASVAFVGIAALSVAPVFIASLAITGTSTLSVTNPVFETSVAITGTSALSHGTVEITYFATATFAGIGVLNGGLPRLLSTVTISASGTFGANANLTSPATVSIAGTALLIASNPIFLIPNVVTSNGVAILTTTPVFNTSATIAGIGLLAATNPEFIAPITTLVGLGILTVDYVYSGPATATVVATSSLAVTPYLTTPTAANLIATGSLAANGYLATPSSVALAGGASASFGAVLIWQRNIAFSGTSTYTALPVQYVVTNVTITNIGILNTNPYNTQPRTILISNTSTLFANGYNYIVSPVATFSGIATFNNTYNYGILLNSSVSIQGLSTLIVTYVYGAAFRAFALASVFTSTLAVSDIIYSTYLDAYNNNTVYADSYID